MKKIILTAMCIVMLFCLAGCGGGYNSPAETIKAYYKAYNDNDSNGVLACYPQKARQYFIDTAGGEDSFEKEVSGINSLGVYSIDILREEALTDTSALDSSLKYIGNLFEYQEAKYVYYKITITRADGTTYPEDPENAEPARSVTVKVDGKWYIFADINYDAEE